MDSTPTILENGHLSWTKLAKISKLLKHITELQKPSYNIIPDMMMQDFFSSEFYSIEELKRFELSRELEPPT